MNPTLHRQLEALKTASYLLQKSTLKQRNAALKEIKNCIFGALFDRLGFNTIKEELFRHLVIARLAYPGSKLKTVDYLRRYRGIVTHEDTIYRFPDTLDTEHKEKVE